MISSEIVQLTWKLVSCDIRWFLHRISMLTGMRGSDARPITFISRLSKVVNEEGPDQNQLLKLLIFSHNLNFEGASISLAEMVCGLKDRHAIVPKVIAFEDGPLHSEYEAQGVSVEVMPRILHCLSTTEKLYREIASLSKQIQENGPDVVMVNTLLNFPAILAAEHAGIPSIWIPRESEPWRDFFRFLPAPIAQQAIAAIGLPRCVVFVAQSTQDVWSEFEQEANFMVIHNALNLKRFVQHVPSDKDLMRHSLGCSDDEIVFLCVGTLCERKGQQDALQALQAIVDRLKVSIRLIFVGDSSSTYGRSQKHFALRFQGNERVRICFESPTDNVGIYYLAADVFLLCSRIESYPRVILEALAFSLPILSTPVFGVVEQIPNPGDALFYRPGDVAQLGQLMLMMANSSSARKELSKRSKARFAQMASFDQMLETYTGVLREAKKYVTQGNRTYSQVESSAFPRKVTG